MSKSTIPLSEARIIAADIVKTLSPHCERIEIAGSIRREKPEVGDIELVAMPKTAPLVDLFGGIQGYASELDAFDISQLGTVIKGGSKYKQIELAGEISLDLFIVTPPAQWGVIYLIRTGSGEFSHRMVTQRNRGGKLPSLYRVKDGVIWSGDDALETPEEIDWFTLCGMGYVQPRDRSI